MLATRTATRSLADLTDTASTQTGIMVHDDGATLQIEVHLDASRDPLLGLPLVPSPGTTISRRATVRLGRM